MSSSRTVEPVGGPVAAAFQQRVEELEAASLSEQAQRSYPAVRQHAEGGCELRTPFQRDRDRIVHSKSFRRLKYKTQVFISPLGDHYRTRLTHTLEVTQVSRTVARALRLNEDLTEAIGLGHDLGHPPFGHVGEDVLNENRQERYGEHFKHNEQSLRIVSVLERDGQGLNLTDQVRNGILNHTSGTPQPESAEGRIVRLVDRIAYINHDIDDALRAGVITAADLPQEEIGVLGNSGSERIDRLVHDLVEHSSTAGDIVQGDQIGAAMLSLRKFMFERVYLGEAARREHSRIRHVINTLFAHYADNPDQLPTREAEADDGQAVIDYISGMTDRFCIRAFEAITVPEAFAE